MDSTVLADHEANCPHSRRLMEVPSLAAPFLVFAQLLI
jgi:hypothetical protein